MCRWMAYKGRSVYLEDWLLNSEHSLIEQSKSADMTQYEVNGDGFGVGWYGQKPQPGLFKSIRPAWNNANLKSLAAHVQSPLFLAHVRYATGTPIQETNSHPFQHRNWLMVHNGIIHDFWRVKKDLMHEIDAQYFNCILGSTDSEILFYLLLTKGLQQDVAKAVRETITLIEDVGQKYQVKNPVSMTLGLSDGQLLWAVRYSTLQNSSTLFYSLEEEKQAPHLLVVSEPLDDCSRCWSPIEENSLIQFDQNNRMTIRAIS
ncbi:MAG: class II glutamine amidotransferase [Enterobacterales bacterium]|nr:class II glutamine amidotransferase [Enterobacterales bacterium]